MKLMVYIDGSPTARQALAFAARWTARLDAELAVITVRSETHPMETPPPLGLDVPAAGWEQLPEGLRILTAAARQLADAGLMPLPTGISIRETPLSHCFMCPSSDNRQIGFHECFGPFIESLNREIDRHSIDLLIIAPPRRSRMRRMILGDTPRKLALELHTSLLIVRGGGPESRMVVCADGSPAGKRAFPLLQLLLPTIRQPVELLWVRSPDVSDAYVTQAEHCLHQAAHWLKTCGKASRVTQIENVRPVDAIATAVGTDALVMIGASLHHDVYGRTLGTLPMRLLAQTGASVLLSKAHPEDDPGFREGRLAC